MDYIKIESENQKFGLIILLVLFHSACPYKNYCPKCFTELQTLFIYLFKFFFFFLLSNFVSGHSNLMASAALASSSPSTAATAVGSTYHTVYINHPSMTAAPVTSTFLYHPSTAAQLSHPPALTSALPLGAQLGERVTSTTSWNVTGQCTSSPYAGETLFKSLASPLIVSRM